MLSSTAEYALRALIVMSRMPVGQPMAGAEIARLTLVPRNYLSKILHALRRAGIVTATRGTGGGYCLGQAPGRIMLADVVEVFDGVGFRSGCFLGKNLPCTDKNPCSIHDRWAGVRQAEAEFLSSTALSDVAGAFEVPGLGGPFSQKRRRGTRGAVKGDRPKRLDRSSASHRR